MGWVSIHLQSDYVDIPWVKMSNLLVTSKFFKELSQANHNHQTLHYRTFVRGIYQ